MKSRFYLLREKSDLPGTTWKSNCTLNLITGCATLCGNNCNQAFAITGNESFTSLWRNFGPLFLAWIVLIQPHRRVFEHEIDCLNSCHSISIGFMSGLWFGHSKTLILFFYSHSKVGLLLCLGSLSCCITQMRLSLRSQTDGRTFSFRIF